MNSSFVAPTPGKTSHPERWTEKLVEWERSREFSAREVGGVHGRARTKEERARERREQERGESKKYAFAGSRTRVASLEGLQAAAAPQTLAVNWQRFGFEGSRSGVIAKCAKKKKSMNEKSDESGIRTHALSEQSLNLPP